MSLLHCQGKSKIQVGFNIYSIAITKAPLKLIVKRVLCSEKCWWSNHARCDWLHNTSIENFNISPNFLILLLFYLYHAILKRTCDTKNSQWVNKEFAFDVHGVRSNAKFIYSFQLGILHQWICIIIINKFTILTVYKAIRLPSKRVQNFQMHNRNLRKEIQILQQT